MKYRTLVLFGAPGSGKGTQGKVLGAVPGFLHFSSGDAFRALDPNSELGRTFKEYSTKGLLVPDELTIRLCVDHLNKLATTGKFNPEKDTLILDGIPRSLAQAKALQPTVNVVAVLNLACSSYEPLVQRMKKRALIEGRKDDADEKIIRERFATYDRQTAPLLDFYGPKLVKTIDALQAPIAVLKDVAGIVSSL
jgi:adenylate kinase